jgi:polyhydroxyalkanoate synthesis regulator phasin
MAKRPVSLDLPPNLLAMLDKVVGTGAATGVVQTAQAGVADANSALPMTGIPVAGAATSPSVRAAGYAMGGEVGPGGMPAGGAGAPPGAQVMPGQGQPTGGPGLGAQAQNAAPMNAQAMEIELKRFMQNHPDEVRAIKVVIDEAIARGEMTIEELDQAVQLATVALQNPAMYPQIVQFAVQRGLVDEGDLDPEYNQAVVFALLLAAKAAQSDTSTQQIDGGDYRAGGEIKVGVGPTADRVNINVSKGEFVIPARVVKEKGTDFFNKLIEPKGGTG